MKNKKLNKKTGKVESFDKYTRVNKIMQNIAYDEMRTYYNNDIGVPNKKTGKGGEDESNHRV